MIWVFRYNFGIIIEWRPTLASYEAVVWWFVVHTNMSMCMVTYICRSWDTAGLGCWGSMWWSRLICGGQIHLFKYHSSGTVHLLKNFGVLIWFSNFYAQWLMKWVRSPNYRYPQPGPAQSIVGPKATILSEVYFYTLNINRMFI